MKVNGLNAAQIQKMYQKQNDNSNDKKIAKNDRMSISDKAQEIKELQTKLKETDEVREEKVKEIKDALESGNYKIEARKVANKILSDLDQRWMKNELTCKTGRYS